MMKLLAAALVLLAWMSPLLVAAQYNCSDPCYGDMCCSVPADNSYYLTTFCDQSTACGTPCSALTYFTADSQRFGCSKMLTICAQGSGTCVQAKVIDAGPNIDVEQEAGMPVIDASAAVCQDLFGSSSCGWSDRRAITAYVSTGDEFDWDGSARVLTPHERRLLQRSHERWFWFGSAQQRERTDRRVD